MEFSLQMKEDKYCLIKTKLIINLKEKKCIFIYMSTCDNYLDDENECPYRQISV